MRKILFVLLLGCLCGAFGFAQNATLANDSAIGYWMSVDDDGVTATGYWQLYLQGDKLFGKMIYAIGERVDLKLEMCDTKPYPTYPEQVNLREKTVIDTVLMWNMEYKAPGQWQRGRIIDPQSGKMYYVKVAQKDGKLKMTGSLDKAGVLGRSQTWVKTTKEKALAAKAARE